MKITKDTKGRENNQEAKQDLFLLPHGFLGAELGDVIGGLADKAALARAHPGYPEWVLPRSGAPGLLPLLEGCLPLLLLLLLLLRGRGRRVFRLRIGEELGIRVVEPLLGLLLPLAHHLPPSLSLSLPGLEYVGETSLREAGGLVRVLMD